MPTELLEPVGDEHEDHLTPADLIELYELLELAGEIVPPKVPRGLLAASPGLVVSRAQWQARAPRSINKDIRPEGSTCHYEGPRMGSFPHTSCASKVRAIQAYHMDQKGWSDIAYTSLVCPHGYIFQGRWWGVRSAANGTDSGNDRSYAHCLLMGVGDPFPDEMRKGLVLAFDLARHSGKAGAKRWVHSDWKATACPGDPARAFVKGGMILDGGSPTVPTQPGTIPPMPQSIVVHEDSVHVVYLVTAYTPNGEGWIDAPRPAGGSCLNVQGQGLDPRRDGRLMRNSNLTWQNNVVDTPNPAPGLNYGGSPFSVVTINIHEGQTPYTTFYVVVAKPR